MNAKRTASMHTRGKKLLATLCAAALGSLMVAKPVAADPPYWAPAHGWRAKHDARHHDRHYRNQHYRKHHHGRYPRNEGFAISYRGTPAYGPSYYAPRPRKQYYGGGGLGRETAGGLVGAAVGGALGSQIGNGSGQLAATAAGTLLGYMVGSSIVIYMDDVDRLRAGRALEYGPINQTVAWTNPDSHTAYAVTPVRTYQTGGAYCREYSQRATIGTRVEEVYGTACRQPDGSWQVVN